ncbi:MAG TPA: toll/interleukin-1 receptor domain-containing protein [Amycolatopsis sp.]|uniref:toll/interleukin-1 receptor domain-containing protein n=1 Tax=Amycolatopsis sp. TaxID=37632 RepID=UPI002B4620A1|nr:toll/interleukin-1 receptor domain-containing protein [Amycolatopsis sp.]HKS48925.1 toll/interleukin-1 receptor domain-containing protein [Amycolatopsis sp.]
MTQVFLNYRTVDEPYGAVMLDQLLSDRFGSAAVFFASKSIPLGAEWEAEMFKAVGESDALLVIMGPQWLTAADEHGNRRIDDPRDFVRREILTAFDLGKQVIPVLLDARRVKPEELPEELRRLCDLQDIKIHFRSARPDVDRLAMRLRQLIPGLRAAEKPNETAPAAKFVAKVESGVLNQAETMHFDGDFYAGPKVG